MPYNDNPPAVPTIPASESGVSIIRSPPYSFRRPAVTRKTPPVRATSSPSSTTRSSAPHASCNAVLRPSTIVSSAMSRLLRVGGTGWARLGLNLDIARGRRRRRLGWGDLGFACNRVHFLETLGEG